jgi:hypothetical protein
VTRIEVQAALKRVDRQLRLLAGLTR